MGWRTIRPTGLRNVDGARVLREVCAPTRRGRYTSPMQRREELVPTISEIVRDAAAMNEAALALDFEKGRFRAQLVIDKIEVAGMHVAVDAAMRVATLLGHPGTDPRPGYSEAMLVLASTLDDIGFDPI